MRVVGYSVPAKRVLRPRLLLEIGVGFILVRNYTDGDRDSSTRGLWINQGVCARMRPRSKAAKLLWILVSTIRRCLVPCLGSGFWLESKGKKGKFIWCTGIAQGLTRSREDKVDWGSW